MHKQFIYDKIDQITKIFANKKAIVDSTSFLTYQELKVKTNIISSQLQKYLIKPNELIAFYGERSIDSFLLLIGILKAGCAYLYLDPTLPKSRANYILEDSEPKLMILIKNDLSLTKLLKLKKIKYLLFEELSATLFSAINIKYNHAHQINDLAYVVYTSGSTGNPKGVLIEHKGIINLANEQSAICNINSNSNVLQFASLSFDAAVSEWSTTLSQGGTLHIISDKEKFNLKKLVDFCNCNKIHVATLPPSLITLLNPSAFKSLKTLLLAGENVNAEIINKWYSTVNLYNAYGPTEGTVCSSMFKCDIKYPPSTIGKPIKNINIYILSEDLKPCKVGQVGEIYISGINLARGYLNLPTKTETNFINNPFLPTIYSKMYRTGDLGIFLADGNIVYRGRIDRQIKIRGYRIELDEIEETIRSLKNVSNAAVITINDKKIVNTKIVAFVKLKNLSIQRKKNIKTQLIIKISTILPSYMIPNEILYLDDIRLTTTGKIDYKSLEKFYIVRSDSLSRSNIADCSKTVDEYQIKKLWGSILNYNQISLEDNFFSSGGTSLLAAHFIFLLNQTFKTNLSITDLYQYPTLRQFITRFPKEKADKDFISLIKKGSDKGTLLLFHPAGGLSTPYFPLSRFNHKVSIYGVDNPFFGHHKGFRALEEMVKSYVERILNGSFSLPIYFGGWSFGGIIALEVACLLNQSKLSCNEVILFDTFNPSLVKQWEVKPNLQAIFNYNFIDMYSMLGSKLSKEITKAEILIKGYVPKVFALKVKIIRCTKYMQEYKVLYKDPFNGWFDWIKPTPEVIPINVSHRELFDLNHIEKVSILINRICI